MGHAQDIRGNISSGAEKTSELRRYQFLGGDKTFFTAKKDINDMKKFLLAAAAALFMALPTFASKANSMPFAVRQADGTMLTVVLHGDEHFSWFTTTDGVVLQRDNGQFYVADISEDGTITATAQLAHDAGARSVEEQATVRGQHVARLNVSMAKARRTAAMRESAAIDKKFYHLPHTGSPTVLVILAEFSDQKFTVSDPVAAFEQYFNGDTQAALGNGDERNYGSVKKYFADMSGGQFTPSFRVVGPVTLPQDMKYYGEDVSGKDTRYPQFVADACTEAAKITSFSDKALDSDNNGYIDLVAIIYAGYGQNNGADANTIWPKTAMRNYGTFGGKVVSAAMMSSELNGNESLIGNGNYFGVPRINGVGVFCHEMTHCMGFPDLYSTTSPASETDNQEMERWSIMDGGEYIDYGYAPTAYTAFEKQIMGWSHNETLVDGQTYTLLPADKGGKAYIYENPNKDSSRADDYLLFENIQKTGWNSRLPGHGLIAYRVSLKSGNLSYTGSPNNVVGDPGMTVVPADGLLLNSANRASTAQYNAELAGDLFPGSKNVTTLTAVQNLPNFAWRTAAGQTENTIGLYNISENEATGEVTFSFVADATAAAVDRVEGVSVQGDSRIFSIDGTCLGTDASVLPKGIYIVGGKKYVK